jgi:DNA-binding IscR family transcriptional regulator
MTALGYFHSEEISSATLAESVNADPTFVRKSLSKLSKAGLVVTKRGKSGASVLARPPRQITPLDICRASGEPPAFAIHSYPADKRCPVSCSHYRKSIRPKSSPKQSMRKHRHSVNGCNAVPPLICSRTQRGRREHTLQYDVGAQPVSEWLRLRAT